MGILNRIGAAYDTLTASEPVGLGLQALASDQSALANPTPWLREMFAGGPSASGKVVTPETSMRVAAVYACVRVLSQSIAQLPLKLYRKTANGAEEATDHPLYGALLNLPNPETTAQDASEMAMNHLCLRGNAYRQIVRAGGKVTEINSLHPDWIRMDRNPVTGELRYHYSAPNAETRIFETGEIWRTIGMSFNGIQGVSPLTYAREAIGLAMATEEHGSKLFVNGAQIATALEAPAALTDEQIVHLKEQMKQFEGSRNAHKTLVLESGMKAQKLSMTSVDSQFIESRRFQLEEICRIWNVPPHKIQELARATFNNIEHLTMDFKNTSLAPYMVRIEQTGYRDLLLPSERKLYFLRHDTSQLDRGDTAALVNLIASGRSNTWLSANEGRRMFNLNDIPNGNTYENPAITTGAEKPGAAIPDPSKG